MGGACVATGALGLRLAWLHPNVTAVWPSAGIALAAVVLAGYRVGPAVLAGNLLVNWSAGVTVPTALALAVAGTAEALLGGYAVRRWAHGSDGFRRPGDVLRFAALAGFGCSALRATAGVGILAASGFLDPAQVMPVWLTCWLAHLAAVLVVAPPIIVWGAPGGGWRLRRKAEFVALVVLVVVVGEDIFGPWELVGATDHQLEFLSGPLLLWAALRFGPRTTSLTTLLLAGIALVGTLQGLGPFARQLPNPSLLVLDAFASTVALSAMVLAATMVAHRAAAAGLLSSTAQLVAAEERVRREIAERLHGRVQTELLVAGHRLGQVESLWQRDPAGALALLDVVRQSIDRVRAEDVRRASHLLHPGTIGLGLLPALRSLAASVSGELEVTVEADPAVMALDDLIGNRIPELVRLAAYRVVEEALANAIRHGGATAATVRVSATGNGGLALTVVDNGVGLDRAGLKPGLGFTMIAARVAQVQGAWRICGRPGVGTKLTVSLPLACRIAESA